MISKKIKIIVLISTAVTALAVLAMFICPWELVNYRTDQARYGDIPSIKTSLAVFRIRHGRFPNKEEGLKALFEKPHDSLHKWQQIMREIPEDPWGNDYVYKINDKAADGFVVYSYGPNSLDDSGGHDDVVSWDKEYSCELNYECPTLCDHLLSILILMAPISWLVVFGAFLFSLYRKMKTAS